MARNDLQGSLDLLVLKTLSHAGKLHGGIVLHIQRASDELLRVEEGSLYPALHRMEQSGWIAAEWGLTDTGRKAK
jgi:PadR family transcriptional regulator PadR